MTMSTKIFFAILFSLAAVGLVVVLKTNPMMLILSIAFAIGMVFLFNRFMTGRRPNDKGYQKALRTQKKKGKLTPTDLHKLTKLKKSSKENPFKVIEGNKKSRASKDKEKQSHYH